MKVEADLVVVNANIITMDPEKPRATALAVKSYKIIVVGNEDSVQDMITHSRRVMDLGGKTIIPGFVDAHTHLTSTGIRSKQADLTSTKSATEVIEKLKKYASKNPDREWIIGWGYDESNWETKKYLTAKNLDTVSKEKPVVAVRIDGHLISVNTVGLDMTGVDLSHEGVEKDKNGNPIGVLKDIDNMYDRFRGTPKELQDGVIAGTKIAASLGITTAVDNVAIGTLRQIREVESRDQLYARMIVNIPLEQLNHLLKLGITSGMGTPLTRIGGVKIFTDGSIGAGTAAVSKPYKGSKDNLGMLLIEKKEFLKIIKKAVAGGIQTVTHAIGDRAIDMILSAFEDYVNSSNDIDEEKALVRKQRHRIEHAEMISEEQIRRAVALGLILSMQPNFVANWQLEGGLYDQSFEKERVDTMNAFRTALDNGARIAFGSDGMPLGPLYGIHAATTHPNPKVRLTVEEALRCYTRESAYASYIDRTIGILKEGARADFVVLSADILDKSMPPQKIKDIKIEMTVMGGETVHSSMSL
ncbi:MAG: amidohydrolase [Candidatus Thorarchaeota archaeon]|nr:amidohydrolase [Candidatus Thorarchaeota archaeon]